MDFIQPGEKSLLTKLGPVPVSRKLATVNKAMDVIPTEMRTP